MRDELSKKLSTKYPKIFRDREFEVNDGWYNILNNACSLITGHIEHKRQEKAQLLQAKRKGKTLADWQQKIIATPVVQQVVATQVKEKFGTLRFYVSGGDEYTEGVIQMAELMSGITCETCGSVGKRRGTGWIHTKCDRCTVNESVGFKESTPIAP